MEATISELGVEDGIGSYGLGFATRIDWLRDDRVDIMVVQYHEVLAATTGGGGKRPVWSVETSSVSPIVSTKSW